MKCVVKMSIILLAVIFGVMGPAFAGNGNGGKGIGPGNGTGPIHDILSGTPFTISGTIVTMVPGQGVEIAATDGMTYTVYGLGPVWYWENQGVDRPAVGDTVEVTGFIVNYNGEIRYIATTVTIYGNTVLLRDATTGTPLWRSFNK
jgi:hypothetical protein